MLTALHRWIARRRVRRAPRPHGRFVDTLFAGGDAAIGDQERPLGCGGFDSSHERRAGLMVQEHVPADAVANALPLGDCLQLHLAEWRGQAPNGHH